MLLELFYLSLNEISLEAAYLSCSEEDDDSWESDLDDDDDDCEDDSELEESESGIGTFSASFSNFTSLAFSAFRRSARLLWDPISRRLLARLCI